jgi:hypothetical protein
MDRLDSLIAGTIGVAIVAAFLMGLAESINAVPFWVITIGVLALALFDYYEGCIKKRKNNNKGHR